MKKIKRMVALFLCIAMAATMLACGNADTQTEEANVGESTTTKATEQEKETEKETEEVTETETIPYVQEPITIEFWYTLSGDNEIALQEIISEFNATNEYGITVNGSFQGNYAKNLSKVVAAYGTGTEPTIALLASGGFETLEDAGALADMSAYVARDNWDLENIPEDLRYYMQFREGKILEFPYLVSTATIFYNKALMTEEPTSLEEWVSTAKDITAKNPGTAGMYLTLDAGFIQRPIIKSLSGDDFTSKDGNSAACIDDGSMLKFMTDWKEWIDGGYCMNIQTTDAKNKMLNAFATGELASFAYSSSNINTIKKFADENNIDLGVCKMVGYGGYAAPLGGGGLVVLDSKSQQEQAAAWEFLKFLYEDSNVVKIHKVTGYMPFTRSSWEDAEIKAFWSENPEFAVAAEQMEWGTYNGWSLYLAEWRTQITNCMTSVLSDASMTPEEMIDYLRTQISVIFP